MLFRLRNRVANGSGIPKRDFCGPTKNSSKTTLVMGADLRRTQNSVIPAMRSPRHRERSNSSEYQKLLAIYFVHFLNPP